MVEFEDSPKSPQFVPTPKSLTIHLLSTITKPYISPGVVTRIYTYEVSFKESPIESRVSGAILVKDPWVAGHVTELKVYAEVRSRFKVVPSRFDLSGGPDGGSSSEFLILNREAVIIPLDQYRVVVEGPFQVEPIDAKLGFAKFRVIHSGPKETDQVAGKLTIRIASIPDETAVVHLTAKGGGN